MLTLNVEAIFASEITINTNGLDKIIKYQNINSTNYIEIKYLASLLNNNTSLEDYAIIYKNEKLKFASGSFFVVYESDKKLRVAQMSLPCIEFKGYLLLPLDAFLQATQGIGLINYRKKFGKYFITFDFFDNEKIMDPTPKVVSKIIENKVISKEFKKADSIINKQNEIKPNYNKLDTTITPGKYFIPENIKK